MPWVSAPPTRAQLTGAAVLLVIMAVTILLCAETLADITAARLTSYFALGNAMPDPFCDSPFCDFPDFWGAGRLPRSDALATSYQPDAFHAWRQNLFHQNPPALSWMYRPPPCRRRR